VLAGMNFANGFSAHRFFGFLESGGSEMLRCDQPIVGQLNCFPTPVRNVEAGPLGPLGTSDNGAGDVRQVETFFGVLKKLLPGKTGGAAANIQKAVRVFSLGPPKKNQFFFFFPSEKPRGGDRFSFAGS